MKASVGRIVHYVGYGTPNGEYRQDHRAAIITQVDPQDFNKIRCTIFNPDGTFNSPWLEQDETGSSGGTWHWPERE